MILILHVPISDFNPVHRTYGCDFSHLVPVAIGPQNIKNKNDLHRFKGPNRRFSVFLPIDLKYSKYTDHCS